MHMQFGVMKWRIPPDYFNFYFSVKCESKVAESEDGDDLLEVGEERCKMVLRPTGRMKRPGQQGSTMGSPVLP